MKSKKVKLKTTTQPSAISDRAILVSVAEFKARLGHYLREIKLGREVLVTDRRNPVALVSQFQEDRPFKLDVTKPVADPTTFFQLKPKDIGQISTDIDSLTLLLEDRKKR